MTTFFKKIANTEDDGVDCPLPLSVIPNHMGINLCAVEYISWQKMNDGQLTNLSIHFMADEGAEGY